MKADTTSTLRICDVIQAWSPISGGVKRYVQEKSAYVRARPGLEQLLITPGTSDTVRRDGPVTTCTVRSMPLPGSKSYRLLLGTGRITRLIKEHAPDVVELDGPYWPGWALSDGRLDTPLVGYYHSEFIRGVGLNVGRVPGLGLAGRALLAAGEAYLRRLYNRMDVTVTATSRFWDILTRIGVDRVRRIPLGANTDAFAPVDSRGSVLEELGLCEDTYLMLFAGRFSGMKNLDRLTAMMPHLESGSRPAHLVCVGDGEAAGPVKRAAAERGDVTWLPYTTDADRLASLYSAADLFVNAAMRETFGLVSVEAQACGTRVLGVAGGGLEATLEGEEPLILAASPEPEDLARAVRAAMLHPDTEKTRAARRERIVANFSIKSTFDRLFSLYARLCQKDIPAAPSG